MRAIGGTSLKSTWRNDSLIDAIGAGGTLVPNTIMAARITSGASTRKARILSHILMTFVPNGLGGI
jgi:hypothetical protein